MSKPKTDTAYDLRLSSFTTSVEDVVERLQTIVKQIERDYAEFQTGDGVGYLESAVGFSSQVTHTVGWGVANLNLSSLIIQAERLDKDG